MGVEPLPLDPKWVQALQGVTTATLTTVLLLKKGLRNVWMRWCQGHASGYPPYCRARFYLAFCARARGFGNPGLLGLPPFLLAPPLNKCPPVAFAVVDAMGVTDAGIFGDILCCTHAKARRGCVELPTASYATLRASRKPICRFGAQGTASPASVAALTFVGVAGTHWLWRGCRDAQ